MMKKVKWENQTPSNSVFCSILSLNPKSSTRAITRLHHSTLGTIFFVPDFYEGYWLEAYNCSTTMRNYFEISLKVTQDIRGTIQHNQGASCKSVWRWYIRGTSQHNQAASLAKFFPVPLVHLLVHDQYSCGPPCF